MCVCVCVGVGVGVGVGVWVFLCVWVCGCVGVHHIVTTIFLSTLYSTGIPDFRSGMNTVLSTGPGKFELKDKKDKLSAEKQADLKKKKVTQVIRVNITI